MKTEIQKTGKLKFETLDSTICTETGSKREDITGRVEDINVNMCQFMGVSKAIINNVIFCHQEDSNWPLDEGKKLKEKFDAIFGTTEYNKAIDKLIKIRKTFMVKLETTKGDKKLYEEHKIQAEQKERELISFRNQVEKAEEELKNAAEALLPLEEKKEKIMEKERSFNEIAVNRLKLKNIVTTKSDDYNALKCKLKRPLKGTIEELEQQKEQFDQDQTIKKNKKEKLEVESNQIAKKEKDLLSSVNITETKALGVTEKIGQMQDLSSERFEKVRDICNQLNIPFDGDLDQSINTQQVNSTYNDIREKISDEENEVHTMKAEADEKDKEFQKKIDKLRDERTKLDTQIESQRTTINSINQNREKIKKELKSSEESIPKLNELNPKIERVEEKLKAMNKNNNVKELKEELETTETVMITIEENLQEIEKDMEILQEASKITGELELKKNDLSRENKEFDRIKNKLMPNFKILFGSKVPETNFRSKINDKKESLEKEVKGMKEELFELQRDSDRMYDRRSNLRKQLETKKSDLKKIQENIDEVCNGNDYMSYLESQKEKVAKLNKELAVFESSKNIYEDYIKKIDDFPCCPLCHKDFDEQNEKDSLKGKLKSKIY